MTWLTSALDRQDPRRRIPGTFGFRRRTPWLVLATSALLAGARSAGRGLLHRASDRSCCPRSLVWRCAPCTCVLVAMPRDATDVKRRSLHQTATHLALTIDASHSLERQHNEDFYSHPARIDGVRGGVRRCPGGRDVDEEPDGSPSTHDGQRLTRNDGNDEHDGPNAANDGKLQSYDEIQQRASRQTECAATERWSRIKTAAVDRSSTALSFRCTKDSLGEAFTSS